MRSETMAAAAQLVNPNADVVKKGAAAMMNINAARGLQDVLSSNLGPKGICAQDAPTRTWTRTLTLTLTPTLCGPSPDPQLQPSPQP